MIAATLPSLKGGGEQEGKGTEMTTATETLDRGARLIGIAIYDDAGHWDGGEASMTADTLADFEAGALGAADEILTIDGVQVAVWKSTKAKRRPQEWYIADLGEHRVFIKN